MKVIEIVISPEGKAAVETKGFTGAECRDASRFLEEALGKRLDEKLTNEFYQASCERQSHERQQS